MKSLIIGIDGFVGGHLKRELEDNGYDVYGTSLECGNNDKTEQLNILDTDSISRVVRKIKPEVIFHMAGQADVGMSWKKPGFTMDLNVKGTINLLDAVKKIDNSIKVLVIGSSDQYGILSDDNFFVDESMPLHPATPYAVSKCAQEQMSLLYAKAYDMNIYLTRSFNHIGVGQHKGFVIPDLAGGIVDVEKGISEKLFVGNLKAERDFSDVRDIVRAYRMIIEKGNKNTVYNVGSGNAYCIEDLMKMMISMAKCKIDVEIDPSRMRKSDTPLVRCNCTKLMKDTGWKPEFDIKDSLFDVLESFRR